MNKPIMSFQCTKLLILSLGVLVSFLLFPLHGVADDKDKQAKVITGAGAHFAWVIFDSLKEELEESSGKKIQLFGKNSNLGMGCNAGIKVAQQNTHDHETFGFVCCPISKKEQEKKNIKVYPLAQEPILILVNKDNPVKNLSTQQVRSIFSGDIKNWKEVGGWDKPIVVVARLHCKKRPGHWKTILPSADAFVKKRINVGSASEMVKIVTSLDSSIGHTGATWEFDKKSNVKAITINNLEATAKNLKNNSYPFHRKLSAITNMQPSNDVLSVIKQVQHGNSFARVAKKYNLLPLNSPNPD